MENYIYRLLTAEDIDKINELYNAAFNSRLKDGFILWKYFSNPSGNAIVAGAFYKNQLVGSGAMIPERMSLFSKEEILFKFTDLMTHPNHQRKGLSKNINQLLKEETRKMNASFSFTLCSTISTKSFVSNKWIFLGKVINFFKPLNLLRINLLFRKNDFKSFAFYDSIGNNLDYYEFKIVNTKIRLKKSVDYLKWRTSNPNFIYKLICKYDNSGQIVGYLIYSIASNNLLNIIDLDSTTNDLNIESQLMLCAEYVAVKEKYRGILVIAIKNTPFYYFMRDKNYLRNPLNIGPLKTILDFDVYEYDKNKIDVGDLSIWDINGMCYDDI